MPLATLSDYIGFSVLWTIPLLSMTKFCLMFRRVEVTSSGRLIDRTEKRDKRLEELIGADIVGFHQKMGARHLEVSELWNSRYVYVGGETLFNRRAVLIVVPGLDLIDYQSVKWIYKREFYIMLNHALIKVQMIKCLSMAIGALVLSTVLEFSFAAAIVGTICTGACLESLCRHIVENRADSFAAEHASVEELQGGLRFLTAAHRESKKLSWIHRGFQWIMQPTYFFRMWRLAKVLAAKDALSPIDEGKIQALQALLEKNNQEEKVFIEAKKQQVLRWIDADED